MSRKHPKPRKPKLSRDQHTNVMLTQGHDAALRVISLLNEQSVTALIRRAIAKTYARDQLFQAIASYIKALRPDQYVPLKKQLQDTALEPDDRLPEEIKAIIKEYE